MDRNGVGGLSRSFPFDVAIGGAGRGFVFICEGKAEARDGPGAPASVNSARRSNSSLWNLA